MGNYRRITTAVDFGLSFVSTGQRLSYVAMTLWRFLKQGFRDTSMAFASTRSDQDWETHCDSSDSWQNMEDMSWCLVNCVFEGCESQSRWWKSVVEAREKGRWSARGLIVQSFSLWSYYEWIPLTISTTKRVNTCLVPSSDSWIIQAKKMDPCTSFCSKRVCTVSCSGVPFYTHKSETHFVVIYFGMRCVVPEAL